MSELVLERLKSEANRHFALGKFASARELYTEALVLVQQPVAPELAKLCSVLYSNRALAIKEGVAASGADEDAGADALAGAAADAAPADEDGALPSSTAPWALVEADCLAAIALDPHNCKAHYLLGVCRCRLHDWVAGVRSLELAREMARRQNKAPALLREFEAAIAAGRFEWNAAHCEGRRRADEELHGFVDALVVGQGEREAREAAAAANATAAAVAAAEAAASVADVEGLMPPASRPANGVASLTSGQAELVTSTRPSTAASRQRPGTASYVAEPLGTPEVLRSNSFPLSGGSANGGFQQPHLPPLSRAATFSGTGGEPTPAPASLPQSSLPPSQQRGQGRGAEAQRLVAVRREAAALAAAAATAVEADFARRRAELDELFREREERRTPRAPPAYFCCPITLELMRDPVVTPSGHSYERGALEHYLRASKAEDPQSRRPLQVEQLMPNLALRDAIGAYLGECPWAHPLLPRDAHGRVAATGMAGRGAGAVASASSPLVAAAPSASVPAPAARAP